MLICFDTVNRILRRHNDTVYYSLAIRAVAQQIDQLYWDSSAPESTEHDRGLYDDSELCQNDDLTHDEYVTPFVPLHTRHVVLIGIEILIHDSKIAILPDEWLNSPEYTAVLENLQTLSLRRAELRKKLKLYRQLQSMTATFRNPQTAIQPNLVSRDGPLTKEMEKTKSLGFRVAGGLVERNRGNNSDNPNNIG